MLYMLGVELEDNPFAHTVLDAFVAKLREPEDADDLNYQLPNPRCINHAYTHIDMLRPIANLIDHAYAYVADREELESVRGEVSSDFLTDLAKQLVKNRGELRRNPFRDFDDYDDVESELHAGEEGSESDSDVTSRKRKRFSG